MHSAKEMLTIFNATGGIKLSSGNLGEVYYIRSMLMSDVAVKILKTKFECQIEKMTQLNLKPVKIDIAKRELETLKLIGDHSFFVKLLDTYDT
eukprot:snap_masked-scaffold_28-processed-gene-3.24-mRNA-1 protein AED:1.00 eAED:1.00 QI:0/-1/0/0/-1/1/1/0/92